MRRVIFHIDVNSAFLSWMAVKLVAEGRPDIRLVPSVVAGDPQDRRSIITSRSIPAGRLGIRTADPVTMALRRCPDLVIVQGDWAWYHRCSEAFIAICRRYSPVLQQFSIDECFLDMTCRLCGEDPVAAAVRLKDEIRTTLGFTVNVGVGDNKLLAKMASDFEKPDKVHTLWREEVPEKMWPLPVRSLLWVGRKTEEKLRQRKVETIGALAAVDRAVLVRWFGDKAGNSLWDNANGIDDSPVVTEVADAKSYSIERTFPADITDPRRLDRALFDVACLVASRIRRDGFRAGGVGIFVKASDFSVRSRQCRLEQPTDVTALLLQPARRLLADIWDGATPIRQVGMSLSHLTREAYRQLSLFGEADERLEYYRRWDREYDAQVRETPGFEKY